jgi:hypothetical protein
MAADHCERDVDQLPVCRKRVLTEQLKSRRLVNRVAFHEDALRALGDGAAAEGAFEVVVLGEATQPMSIELCQSFASASVM